MKSKTLFIVAVTMLALPYAVLCAPAPAPEVTPELEQALLAEDWPKVADLLAHVDASTPSPVLRLLKGHACLALNRNNEALCLFQTISAPEEMAVLQDWIDSLLTHHRNSAICRYLFGDLQVRQRRTDDAKQAFGSALDLSSRHKLTLNARGVLLSMLRQWDDARRDFDACQQADPSFAEVWASRGTYIILQNTDATKAHEYFSRALSNSPDYVLALNGRGAMSTVLGRLDEAASDLERAHSLSHECLSNLVHVVNANLAALTEKVAAEMASQIDKTIGAAPGMTLNEKVQKLDTLSKADQQRVVDAVGNAVSFNNWRQGSSFTPDQFEAKVAAGVKGSVMGPQPHVEISGAAKFDYKAKSDFNLNQQSTFLDAANTKYGLQPSRGNSVVDNVRGFLDNHFGPARDFSQPGGVSMEEMDSGVDEGNWKVWVLFGLVYPKDINSTL